MTPRTRRTSRLWPGRGRSRCTTSRAPAPQSAVWAAVDKSLTQNDCVAADNCTWTAQFTNGALADIGAVNNSGAAIPAGAVGVHVNVTQQVGAIIGHAIGFNSWPVSVEATARARGSQGSFPAGVMLPIAVCGWYEPRRQRLRAGVDQSGARQLRRLPAGPDLRPHGRQGRAGRLRLAVLDGSNAANALADAICNPQNPAFSLDSPYDAVGAYGGVMGTNPTTGETWFPIDPGKSNASAVARASTAGSTAGRRCCCRSTTSSTGNGNNAAYHITGVAAFVLTSRSQPAIDNIQGYFVEYYPYTDVPGGATAPPPSPEDTTFEVGLVK